MYSEAGPSSQRMRGTSQRATVAGSSARMLKIMSVRGLARFSGERRRSVITIPGLIVCTPARTPDALASAAADLDSWGMAALEAPYAALLAVAPPVEPAPVAALDTAAVAAHAHAMERERANYFSGSTGQPAQYT